MALKAVKFHLIFKSLHLFIFFLLLFTAENEAVFGDYLKCLFLNNSEALAVSSKVALSLPLMYFVTCLYLILCFFLMSLTQPADALTGNCLF
jgi:hypothetical protein